MRREKSKKSVIDRTVIVNGRRGRIDDVNGELMCNDCIFEENKREGY